MVATVDPLPGLHWSGRAVIGDALQRVSDNDTVIVLWIDPEGKVRYSKNTTNSEQLIILTSFMNYLCNTMWKLKEEA